MSFTSRTLVRRLFNLSYAFVPKKDNRNRDLCENDKGQQNKRNNLYFISGWFNIPNAPGELFVS